MLLKIESIRFMLRAVLCKLLLKLAIHFKEPCVDITYIFSTSTVGPYSVISAVRWHISINHRNKIL